MYVVLPNRKCMAPISLRSVSISPINPISLHVEYSSHMHDQFSTPGILLNITLSSTLIFMQLSDAHYQPENTTIPVANATCYSDTVDFTLCFEDTAILYGICIIFWVLAGFSFLCGGDVIKRASSTLPCGSLHIIKVV